MSKSALEQEYENHLRGRWCDIQGHLPFLRAAVSSRQGAVVIELGTRFGESTLALLAGAEQSLGAVWSCDIVQPQVPEIVARSPRWHFVKADDLSEYALQYLPGKCDVLFMDAHADTWTPAEVRDHFLAEMDAYVARVRPGGVILAHDTQWQPPGTDLGRPVGGVAQALDIWCKNAGLTWTNRPGHYGLGVLEVPA